MFFFVFFFLSFSLFVLNASNIYTVMGGQHRWAPAFLAVRHHIYFFHLLLYMSYLANKIVVVVVLSLYTVGWPL